MLNFPRLTFWCVEILSKSILRFPPVPLTTAPPLFLASASLGHIHSSISPAEIRFLENVLQEGGYLLVAPTPLREKSTATVYLFPCHIHPAACCTSARALCLTMQGMSGAGAQHALQRDATLWRCVRPLANNLIPRTIHRMLIGLWQRG
jgi:hypothetical protein